MKNKNILLILGISLVIFGLWRMIQKPETSITSNNPVSIGIVQIIEHPALDQTRKGIVEELNKAGLNPHIFYESAQGNPSLALQIAQKFVGNKVQVIIALGTTAAQACVKAASNTNIPVVFSSITDPVGAKLVKTLTKPGLNSTGVSNFVEPDRQFEVFKKIIPRLKKLGIIYNPGEANSVSVFEKMKNVAGKFDITLVPISASKTSEVASAASNLIGKVDAIFINNDNTALSAFEAVAKVGKDNVIPVFVSDIDLVNKGAVAALGANQFALGIQTAQMVIKIIKGKKAAETPVEMPEKVKLEINLPVANALDIEFKHDLVPQTARLGN